MAAKRCGCLPPMTIALRHQFMCACTACTEDKKKGREKKKKKKRKETKETKERKLKGKKERKKVSRSWYREIYNKIVCDLNYTAHESISKSDTSSRICRPSKTNLLLQIFLSNRPGTYMFLDGRVHVSFMTFSCILHKFDIGIFTFGGRGVVTVIIRKVGHLPASQLNGNFGSFGPKIRWKLVVIDWIGSITTIAGTIVWTMGFRRQYE